MSEKHDYNLGLFVPFLIHAFTCQALTVVTRIDAAYRAIELEIPIVWFGIINAGYALLPIFLAVQVGRYIDKGNDSKVVWAGSGITLLSNFLFWGWATSGFHLMTFTIISGVGHLLLMAGHQAMTLRCSGPKSRESVIGTYMVLLSMGQMLAPIWIAWTAGSAKIPPTQLIFLAAVVMAIIAFAMSFTLRPAPPMDKASRDSKPVAIMELVRIPGLVVVIISSVVTVTAFDLLVIYLPLLGAERDIPAATIGWLFTVRALASVAARVLYPSLVRIMGRTNLALIAMMLSALSFAVMGLTNSIPVMYGASIIMGIGLGISVTLAMSNVIELSPLNARGTALSLRLTGNRIGQFSIPAMGSMMAALAGVSGVFLIIAIMLAASGLSVQMTMKKR